MIEVERTEYDEYIEAMTRLSIVKRLIEDEEKNGFSSVDCDELRAVLGMPRKGKDVQQ